MADYLDHGTLSDQGQRQRGYGPLHIQQNWCRHLEPRSRFNIPSLPQGERDAAQHGRERNRGFTAGRSPGLTSHVCTALALASSPTRRYRGETYHPLFFSIGAVQPGQGLVVRTTVLSLSSFSFLRWASRALAFLTALSCFCLFRSASS